VTASDSKRHSSGLAIPNVREDFGRPWRWLTVIAGLLMVVSFFLPLSGDKFDLGRQQGPHTFVYSGPGSTDEVLNNPFLLWKAFLGRLISIPASWWPACLSFFFGLVVVVRGLPYFWGLTMFAYSLAQLGKKNRVRQVIHVTGLVVSLSAAVAGVHYNYHYLVNVGASYIVPFVLFLTITLLPALHAILAIRQGSWAYLYHGFTAALTTLAIMVLFHLTELLLSSGADRSRLSGLALAFTAAVLLLIGRIGEARAISRLSWLKTSLCLLALRLHRKALPLGHCPKCGYNLFGLPTPRCPECGRPFSLEEVGPSPETASFKVEEIAICDPVRSTDENA